MIAVQHGHFEVAEALLASGANPNAVDALQGFATLHMAVRKGNGAMARLLVAKGADVHKRDGMGYNASWWARELDNEGLLAEVPPLPAPACPGMEELWTALKNERLAHGLPLPGVGGKKGKKKKGKGKKKK